MNEYHKIQTVFKRDPETKFKTLLEGQFATPEFDYLRDNIWVFTEKVDGTNIRVKWNSEFGMVSFEGKTDRAQIPQFLVNELHNIFDVGTFPGIFDDDVCLYGEGYGAKIQKGGGNYIPDGCSFVLFDVKAGDWWLKRDDVVDIADKLAIKVVPVLKQGTLGEMVDIVKCGGFSSDWSTDKNEFSAEGIVARPETELKDRAGRRIITKIKMKDFR